MQAEEFELVKTRIAAAPVRQILAIERFIGHVVSERVVDTALARRTEQLLRERACPRCKCNDVVLHGTDQNKRQRFKCRGCRRTYNIMTGTPMARARMPDKWAPYLRCMTDHMAVRKIVGTGIGINHVTAWRWRHRFLTAAANDNAAVLSGVIQAKETFFPRSFKGSRGCPDGMPDRPGGAGRRSGGARRQRPPRERVPVLTALDSSGGVLQAILGAPVGIEAALGGRIAAGSVLCSEASLPYATAAAAANAEHYVVSASVTDLSEIRNGPIQIRSGWRGRLRLGRVDEHHRRLKHLVDERCLGVATKYLWNYLGWNRAMTRPGFEGRALLDRALALSFRK